MEVISPFQTGRINERLNSGWNGGVDNVKLSNNGYANKETRPKPIKS